MQLQHRTCFSCKNRRECRYYYAINAATTGGPFNLDDPLPNAMDSGMGKWSDIFVAVGNCCRKYNPIPEEVKLMKSKTVKEIFGGCVRGKSIARIADE